MHYVLEIKEGKKWIRYYNKIFDTFEHAINYYNDLSIKEKYENNFRIEQYSKWEI